jgi:hypothetical protein
MINPLKSEAVWGAGWYNAAETTNYADNQQHFEGGLSFELQAENAVWSLLRNWFIEQRAFPQSLVFSPNGYSVHTYSKSSTDPRGGVWAKSVSFEIGAQELIKVNTTCVGLKRVETNNSGKFTTSRAFSSRKPVKPLNPSPYNRNPAPGWYSAAAVTWPGSPTFWTPANLTGMVLTSGSMEINNNTQIVFGCTGDPNPVAVIQGPIEASGNMSLWRDGGIPDPYGNTNTPFSASGASVTFTLAGISNLTLSMPYVVLNTDAYNVKGQKQLTSRDFGFFGLGDGINPPMLMGLGTGT